MRKQRSIEYLRKKEEAGICLAFCFVLSMVFLSGFLFCAWFSYVVIRSSDSDVYWSLDMYKRDMLYLCASVLSVLALFVWLSARSLPRKVRKVVRIHSLSLIDVSELPAEEVLVRGSEEPSAPSETLLRATLKGEETKPDELLRADAGTAGEHDL